MKLGVIVPFRASEPWRSRAWLRVSFHLSQVFPGVPVTVADDAGDPFSRGGSITHAARLDPDADVFVVCDADLIVPAAQLREAVRLSGQGPGLVVPFSRYLYLTANQTRRITDHRTQTLPTSPRASWTMQGSVGGAGVFDRHTLEQTGGYPPVFRGWGFEDEAFVLLADMLAGPTRRVEGDALHLYHPVDVTNDPTLPGYRRNADALERLVAAAGRGRSALLTELNHLSRSEASA